MGIIVKDKTVVTGATILAADPNDNFDTIYDEFNGKITNANIDDAAAIESTKLDLASSNLTGQPTISDYTNAGHVHSNAANGGQLDWDTCFSDAAHNHSSAAEGGSALAAATLTTSSTIVAAGLITANGGVTTGNGDNISCFNGDIAAQASTSTRNITISHNNTNGVIDTSHGSIILDPTTTWVLPVSNKGVSLGVGGVAFDNMYADDFVNEADIPFLDEYNDVATINAIKKGTKICEKSGLPVIDDSTLPDWLLVKEYHGDKKGEVAISPDGNPYYSTRTMIGLLLGAIKELSTEIEILKK